MRNLAIVLLSLVCVASFCPPSMAQATKQDAEAALALAGDKYNAAYLAKQAAYADFKDAADYNLAVLEALSGLKGIDQEDTDAIVALMGYALDELIAAENGLIRR